MKEVADNWVRGPTGEGLAFCMKLLTIHVKKMVRIEEIKENRLFYAFLNSM